MLPRRPAVLVASAVAVLGLAACSNSEPAVVKNPHTGSESAQLVSGVQVITLTSGGDLRFHPSTFTVHQGKVKVILKNDGTSSGGPPHNFDVTGLPGTYLPTVDAGGQGSVTFTAPAPGSYQFVCTIHLAEGQTGTMIVDSGPP
jgi:plastocyanin